MSSEIGLLTQSSHGVSASEILSESTHRNSPQDSKPSIFAKKLRGRQPPDSHAKSEASNVDREPPKPHDSQSRLPKADASSKGEQPDRERPVDPADRNEVESETAEIGFLPTEARQPLPKELPVDQSRLPEISLTTRKSQEFSLKAPAGFVAQYSRQSVESDEPHSSTPSDIATENLQPTELLDVSQKEAQTEISVLESNTLGEDQSDTIPSVAPPLVNESDGSNTSDVDVEANPRDQDRVSGSQQAIDESGELGRNGEPLQSAEEVAIEVPALHRRDSNVREQIQTANESNGETSEDDSTVPVLANRSADQSAVATYDKRSLKPRGLQQNEPEKLQTESSQPKDLDANRSQSLVESTGDRELVATQSNSIPSPSSEVKANEPELARTDSKPIETSSTSSEATAPLTNRSTSSSSPEIASPRTDPGESATRMQALVDRVADAVETAGRQQSTRPLRIRLDPPELGVLSIEVQTQGGQVSARLHVESSASQRLLLDHLPQLQDALAQQTGGTAQVEIQRSESTNADSQQHGFAQDQSTSQQQQERQRQANSTKEPLIDGPETPDESQESSQQTHRPNRTNAAVGIDIEV